MTLVSLYIYTFLPLIRTHLISRSSLQAVGVKLVHMQDVNGTLDAEVMQLAGDFKEQ